MGLAGGKRRLHITRMRGVFKYLCLHLFFFFFFFVLHHWKETMDFYRALNLDHYNIYMVGAYSFFFFLFLLQWALQFSSFNSPVFKTETNISRVFFSIC